MMYVTTSQWQSVAVGADFECAGLVRASSARDYRLQEPFDCMVERFAYAHQSTNQLLDDTANI
jgi:hypothetical protein